MQCAQEHYSRNPAPLYMSVAAAITTNTGCKPTIHRNGRSVRRAKTKMNVSRYKLKGTTHRKGIGVISLEIYVVTPKSRLEGTSDNASQRERHSRPPHGWRHPALFATWAWR